MGVYAGGASGEAFTCLLRRHRRPGFHPWVGRILWRRKWLPTPVFLPGKPYGQRSLLVHGVPKSQTQLSKWAHTHIKSYIYIFLLVRDREVPGSSLGRIQGVPSGRMASAREKTRETSLDRAKSVFYFFDNRFYTLSQNVFKVQDAYSWLHRISITSFWFLGRAGFFCFLIL